MDMRMPIHITKPKGVKSYYENCKYKPRKMYSQIGDRYNPDRSLHGFKREPGTVNQ